MIIDPSGGRAGAARADTTARAASAPVPAASPRPAVIMQLGAERFWAKVDTSGGDNVCWPWLSRRDRKGHGQVWLAGRHQYAHRFAFELVVGAIPAGQQIDHRCCNPWCVNFRHLDPVSPAVNVRRSVVARSGKACKNGHPKTLEHGRWRLEFVKNRAYLAWKCRTCDKERNRERYATDPEYRERALARSREQRTNP